MIKLKKILANEIFAGKSASYTNAALWTEVFHQLEIGSHDAENANQESEPSKQVDMTDNPLVVPVTKLRDYYEGLKKLDQNSHEILAKGICENLGLLESLWEKSRKTFSEYENTNKWANDENGRRELPVAPDSLDKVGSTNQFTSFFIEHGMNGNDSLKYVFREINPWRTRGGVFKNGKPATKTGKGGIDLLLSNNGVPVVGEVKVKSDKNAFFALIQSLAYAVELSTKNQQKRLKATFPNAFEEIVEDEPKIEIAIILVNKTSQLTLEATKQLVNKINESNKFEGLGRVSIFRNQSDVFEVFATSS